MNLNLLSCGYDDSIRLWRYDGEDWVSSEKDILDQHK